MKISEELDWGGINDGFLTPAPPPISHIRPSFAYYIFILEQAQNNIFTPEKTDWPCYMRLTDLKSKNKTDKNNL